MNSVNVSAIELNSAVERGVKSACVEFSTKVVQTLADRFGFDIEEAMRVLSLDDAPVSHSIKKKAEASGAKKSKKTERDIPKMVLPFCGAVIGWCFGLRFNHGLYTQCTNAKAAEGEFCGTCKKQADANSNGKPNFGTVHDRIATGTMDYVDPKGKKVVAYANVMAKLKLTREAAVAEAARFDWVIPEFQFAIQEKKRGRPKSASASSSDTEAEKPKARGRPRKEKQIGAATNVGDDLLAALQQQAAIEGGASASEEVAETSGDEESEKAERSAMAEADKESKKAAKSADSAAKKEAKKAAAEAEKAAKKAAADAERAAKKAAKEADAAAAKAAKAAEKEAEKAARKAAKDAQRAANKEAKKSAKKSGSAATSSVEASSADESAKPVVVAVPVVAAAAAAAAEESEEAEEEQEIVLSRRNYKGKAYYVDANTDLLYNPETGDVIGSWNTEKNKPEIDE